ncbi:MFS transporter [Streptomyces blattellae]|uniref:MFS transporter n=1 Tax=Streptomyces blattellae TaxID=2569855 RepID=UPI0012B9F082|nr:MFS transporter [Streptomyces blattellae]
MTTTMTVLRDRAARLYLGAVAVSGFGTSALWLASGVWVKDLTGSDGLAALCMLALWAPTVAGPALGTFADRTRRKPLLVALNLVLAGLLLTLLTVDSPADLWLLFTVLAAYGTASVVHEAAKSALVAASVSPELLGDFNGLRMSAVEGMKLVAPLAGAGVYAAYGGQAVALVDAVSFLGAAVLYARVRVREKPRSRATRAWRREGVEGARFLWGHPRLRPLVLAGGTTMLFAGLNGAMVYAVVEGLGHSPAFSGVLYAAQGAGSVAVGLVSGPALRRLGERRFAGYGIALSAAAVALRAVPSDAVAVVCGAATGAGLPCVLIAALTAVQRETPDRLRGRVAATAGTLVFAPNAVGLAVGAGLVELVDLRALLVVLGLGQLLALLPLRASRTASRSASDANPA